MKNNEEKIYNLEHEILSLIYQKEKNIKEIIENNKKETKLKEIELRKLIFEEEKFRILKEEIPEIKGNEFNKNDVNEILEKYKKSLDNKKDFNKIEIIYSIIEKISEKEMNFKYLEQCQKNEFEENIQAIGNIFEENSLKIELDLPLNLKKNELNFEKGSLEQNKNYNIEIEKEEDFTEQMKKINYMKKIEKDKEIGEKEEKKLIKIKEEKMKEKENRIKKENFFQKIKNFILDENFNKFD